MKTKLLFCFLLLSLLATAQTYKFSMLYSFKNNGTDPSDPIASLIVDSAGNLYGTSYGGGSFGLGTIFKVTKSGKLTVLYSFQGGTSDGQGPQASLTRDASGNLYGTTADGGNTGNGVVFKLSPSNQETILFGGFDGGVNGGLPNSVLRDSTGNLFGTATEGGLYSRGLEFKLDTANNFTVLHNFCAAGYPDCPDGSLPDSLITAGGNFYGTTEQAGTLGHGVLYEITPEGVETVLHTFGGTGDGQGPAGSLRQDAKGNLYGATQHGGVHDPTGRIRGGILFKQPEAGGPETVLYNFGSLPKCADGCYPSGPIAIDKTGNIYGVAFSDGNLIPPAKVWEVSTAGKETILYTFGSNISVFPAITIDSAGNLYGVTYSGGPANSGGVFKLTLQK